MKLVEAAFEVPRMLAEIGEREGVTPRAVGVHSIWYVGDGTASSVYLDLTPDTANEGQGVLIIRIDDACVNHETMMAVISNDHGTAH